MRNICGTLLLVACAAAGALVTPNAIAGVSDWKCIGGGKCFRASNRLVDWEKMFPPDPTPNYSAEINADVGGEFYGNWGMYAVSYCSVRSQIYRDGVYVSTVNYNCWGQMMNPFSAYIGGSWSASCDRPLTIHSVLVVNYQGNVYTTPTAYGYIRPCA